MPGRLFPIASGGKQAGARRDLTPRRGATNERDVMITAHDLSLGYAQAISAYWRGDSGVLPRFNAWLVQYWVDGPTEPAAEPQAHCPYGAAGHGIRWYERGAVLQGFVPGRRGCFQVPRNAVLPRETSRRVAAAIVPAIAA